MPIMAKNGSILVRPGSGILATSCGGGGCTGMDTHCSACACEAALSDTYLVTLSGFHTQCMVQAFNGTWELALDDDCYWIYEISPYLSISLLINPMWKVTWSVHAPSGPSGSFIASRAIWQPNTAYPGSDPAIYNVYTDNNSQVAFKLIQEGTSGANAPSWTDVIGATMADGTCIWKCVSACRPETCLWGASSDYMTCASISGCSGLCAKVRANAKCTVEPGS